MKQPNVVVVGSLNMDIVVEAPRFPQVGKTISGTAAHFIPGGKGANQAVAAARLGSNAVMVGFVGTDAFGEELLQSLEANQVVTTNVRKTAHSSTGIASILLADDDNHIVVVPGANAYCLPEHIELLEETIAGADIVVAQLEIPLETVCRVAEFTEKHGKKLVLNPAPAAELPAELLRRVDYLTPNRSELEVLTGINTSSEEGLHQAIDAMLAMGPRCVVTTVGEKGAVYKRQGEALSAVPAHKVAVVDTTGAGDAFNAGLAFALAAGQELDEAVRFGCKVSALAVTGFGAQAGMPTMEQVQAYQWV